MENERWYREGTLQKKGPPPDVHARFMRQLRPKKGATTFNIKVETREKERLPSIPTTVVWPSAATRTITDYREPEPCARDGALIVVNTLQIE